MLLKELRAIKASKKIFLFDYSSSKLLFLFAFIPRLFLTIVALFLTQFNTKDIFSNSDAGSYLMVARNILSNARVSHGFDERVFPGWPMTFAPLSLLISPEWACLVMGVILASLLPVAYFKLTKELLTSLLLCFLTPTFVMHSNNGMSEPAYLLYIVLSMMFFFNKKTIPAAFLIGIAALVRPTAFFPWIGMFVILLKEKSWKNLILFCLVSGLTTSSLFLFNIHFYDDYLRQFHSYSTLPNVSAETLARLGAVNGGSHFGLPFINISKATYVLNIPVWKLCFIWAHVFGALLSIYIGFREKLYSTNIGLVFLIWAVLNSIFIFSTGEYWAFHSFDRYITWGLPAYIYLVKDKIKLNTTLFYFLITLSLLASAFGAWKSYL